MTKLLPLLLLIAACQNTDVAAATSSAAAFAKNIPNATGTVCAEVDTDHDGYVTCTVFRGEQEPMQIQCGSERICVWNCARGCKYEPSMKLRGRRAASE